MQTGAHTKSTSKNTKRPSDKQREAWRIYSGEIVNFPKAARLPRDLLKTFTVKLVYSKSKVIPTSRKAYNYEKSIFLISSPQKLLDGNWKIIRSMTKIVPALPTLRESLQLLRQTHFVDITATEAARLEKRK